MSCCSTVGDTSWARVDQWTETVNTQTGQVVSSTHDSQLAGQAAGHGLCIICTPIASLIAMSFAGFFWLLSAPVLCCGDGAMPEEPWIDRCYTKREAISRFEGTQSAQCECCFYACYKKPAQEKNME